MFSLIVAFPRLEDAKNLKNVLKRYGYSDVFSCNSGAQVISAANELDGGVVISGYRLTDMHYRELYGYLPREFSMLLVASPSKLEECLNQNIICLGMPIRTNELVDTLNMMSHSYPFIFILSHSSIVSYVNIASSIKASTSSFASSANTSF
ncbi:MAG: hypothetical protein J6I65_00305, partial [Lachnospiraceae bacterium]|nr:hypothetical protein [Lachnospiraceae bacterium]